MSSNASAADRSFAFLRMLEERVAARIEAFAYGIAVVDEERPRVYDLNYLRLDEGAPDASALAAEAERIQGAIGLGHRRVDVRNEAGAARLEPKFEALGWTPERFVLMVHGRDPDRTARAPAVEVDEATIRPVWEVGIRESPWPRDDPIVEQLLEQKRLIAAAVPTRYFAAAAEGRLASYCELYSVDGVGQIEAVATLATFRDRGLARAVVLRAAAESRSAGNELTFLVASADDWPRELYAKLGFDVVGRYGRFWTRVD